jgi:simple sugar transport system permease protein
MLGINVKRTRFIAHVICGLLAGIGGFLYLFHTRSGSVQQATGLEMDAIAASLIVTAIGSQDPWWPQITRAGMLCFFIILQSVICSRKRKTN